MADAFQYLGKINASSWLEKIKNFTTEDWNFFELRQKSFAVHRQTLTIPFIWDFKRDNKPSIFHICLDFEEQIKELSGLFEKKLGPGEFVRLMLVKLPVNSVIDRHVDTGANLIAANRCHIALATNPNAFLEINGISKNLEVGDVWKINNEMDHSACNNGDSDRIHIIADWKTN